MFFARNIFSSSLVVRLSFISRWQPSACNRLKHSKFLIKIQHFFYWSIKLSSLDAFFLRLRSCFPPMTAVHQSESFGRRLLVWMDFSITMLAMIDCLKGELLLEWVAEMLTFFVEVMFTAEAMNGSLDMQSACPAHLTFRYLISQSKTARFSSQRTAKSVQFFETMEPLDLSVVHRDPYSLAE